MTNVPEGVAKWLREQSHEVCSVYEELRGATDDQILSKAVAENWIVITNDKDFGEMVFREQRPHRGIVFLRLQDERTVSKISALDRLLANYADRLADSFTVVTETQVRFASF